MGTKNSAKKKAAVVDCSNPGNPNNGGKPYTLTEFLPLLKDRDFARDFLDLLRRAGQNEKGAIDCVNAYLEPTGDELTALGIPASQIEPMRKCTDVGLLVMVTAQQNSI
jgi:hypothetical protein